MKILKWECTGNSLKLYNCANYTENQNRDKTLNKTDKRQLGKKKKKKKKSKLFLTVNFNFSFQ